MGWGGKRKGSGRPKKEPGEAPNPGEAPEDPPPPPKDQPAAHRVDPVPPSGVRMQPELQGKSLQLKFAWRAPLGAAVFRRGAPAQPAL